MADRRIAVKDCKELISSILGPSKTSILKERRTAARLLKIWPELDFWRSLSTYGRVYSLEEFLTDSAINYLNQQYGGFQIYLKTKEASKESSISELDKNNLDIPAEIPNTISSSPARRKSGLLKFLENS